MARIRFRIAHNFFEHIRRANDMQLRLLTLLRTVTNPPDLLRLHHSTMRSSSPIATQADSSKRCHFLRTCFSVKMPSENLARSLTSSSFSRKVFEGTKLMANLSGQLIVGQLCTRAPVLYHESEHHAATRQGAQMTTIFDRLAAGRPAPPIEKPKRQPKELAEALLGWLERWPKNIVSSRDIRIWGPLALHNREAAIRSAEILVAHGRLHPHPLKPRVWKIVRDPLIPSSRP